MRRWLGSLYWASEDSETEHHFIANFNVEAKMRRDAMKAVLDEHWDDRLDAASCYPVFKWGAASSPSIDPEVLDLLRRIDASLKLVPCADGGRDAEPGQPGSMVMGKWRAESAIDGWVVDLRRILATKPYDFPKSGSMQCSLDQLRLQPKEEPEAVGHNCSICEEVIVAGEAAVRDGDDFAHLYCSVLQVDGDDIDREHGAS